MQREIVVDTSYELAAVSNSRMETHSCVENYYPAWAYMIA